MILIASGANLPGPLGTPAQTLAQARTALGLCGINVVRCSRTWLSAPVPVSDQPWYHNEVMAVETSLSAFALLEALQSLERDFGRVRTARNEARILDLDLLAYHDQILDRPELIVPHPRLQDRAFVLLPLREVAPVWRHPVSGLSVDEMIENLPPGQEIRAA